MSQRRYSEAEVRAIVRRAAEIETSSTLDLGSGVTLEQIQAGASELGIAPAAIRKAATELETQPPQKNRFLGVPTSIKRSRVVSGQTDASAWSAILNQVRRSTGRVGYPTTIGQSFDWISKQSPGMHVCVAQVESEIKIDAQFRFGDLLIAFLVSFIGLGFVVSMGVGLSMGVWGLATVFLCLAACLIGARTAFRRTYARSSAMMDDLLDGLEQTIVESSGATTSQSLASPSLSSDRTHDVVST